MIGAMAKKLLFSKLINEGADAFFKYLKENPSIAKFFNFMTEEEQSNFIKAFDSAAAGGFDMATVIQVGGEFILPTTLDKNSIYGPGAIIKINPRSNLAAKFKDIEKTGVVLQRDPEYPEFDKPKVGWLEVDFGNNQIRALRYDVEGESDVILVEPAVFEAQDREMVTLSFSNGSTSINTNILGLKISFGDMVLVNHQNGFIMSVKKDETPIGYKGEITNIHDKNRLEVKVDGSSRIIEFDQSIIGSCTKGDTVLVDKSYSVALELISKKARTISKESSGKITLNDVIGLEEAKKSIEDYFLKRENKDLYASALKSTVHSSSQSAGMLLTGPPGNGKTMLMKAVANSKDATLLTLNSTEALQKYVGDGPAIIRNLAEEAAKISSDDHLCIIFIDEIDAIGKERSAKGENEHLNALTNALLTSMDGTDSSSNVLWVGATNRGDLLDEALTREGRLDQTFYIGRPTGDTINGLFELYLRGVKIKDSENDLLDYAVSQYTSKEYSVAKIRLEGDTEDTLLSLEDFGSGAMIENIAATAIRIALRRDVSEKKKEFSGISKKDIQYSFQETYRSVKSKNLINAIKEHVQYDDRELISVDYIQ